MSGLPRVVVAGLGPGGDRARHGRDAGARSSASPHRFLRTVAPPVGASRRPARSRSTTSTSRPTRFDDVYAEIADRLVAAAASTARCCTPCPGRRSCSSARCSALRADPRIECELLPAMSFLDLAWARLGIDPVEAGVRLVDGHEFAEAGGRDLGRRAGRPHARQLGAVRHQARIDDPAGAIDDTPVVLLQALGTPDERIVHTTWAEIDRTIEADHLTSLYIPSLTHAGRRRVRAVPPAGPDAARAVPVGHRADPPVAAPLPDRGDLRGGRRRSSSSTPTIRTPTRRLIEELGDLLYQIEFHATIAEQEGRFTIADVTARRARQARPPPPARVRRRRRQRRRRRRDRRGAQRTGRRSSAPRSSAASVFDGVPTALPSLATPTRCSARRPRSASTGRTSQGALPKIAEEAGELRAPCPPAQATDGDRRRARRPAVRRRQRRPPPRRRPRAVALRAAGNKFRVRFEQVERLAGERGIDLHAADLPVLDALWDEVKAARQIG